MAPRTGYGTLTNDSPAADEIDAERAAMLQTSSSKNAFTARCSDYMNVNVTKSWGDVALLGCYIITGLLDSSAIMVWGSFASMQTGNTVYLGLGLVAPSESDRWLRALISIACFCLGSLFFSTLHRTPSSPRKRWVLIFSFALQTLLILIAALMATLGPTITRSTPLNPWVGVSLALVAFQSAGQAVASRALQYSGLTSVVLTSNYCDLFSDPGLFRFERGNVERNRRAAAPVLLLAGALVGGAFAHSSVGLVGALWTAVALKAVVVVAWAVWAPECE